MLDKTIDKLDKEATKLLAQVQSDVSALENKTAQDADRIAHLAVEGVIAFPLSNKVPQVTFLDPSFEVAPGDGLSDKFMLQVTGVFPQAPEQDYQPYVTIANQHVAPTVLTTQKLSFLLPRSLLSPSGHATSFIQVPITVPFKTGWWIFGKKEDANFKASVVGLPPSVGNLTLFNLTSATIPRSAHVTTGQDNMQSDRDDHEEVRCGRMKHTNIDPNTVRVVFERTEGNSSSYHRQS